MCSNPSLSPKAFGVSPKKLWLSPSLIRPDIERPVERFSGDPMPSHEKQGADFISILVADSTRIHTQLLADAMRSDHGLQVVATASTSQELLDAVVRVPIDVAVISYGLDDQPGRGTEVLRQMRALRPQIKGVLLLDSSRPQNVLECFRAGAKGIFSKHEKLESLCKC